MGTCVSPCLLVYDAAKRPFLQEPIHAGFRVLPQAGNYASFHTSDGQGWSVLMRSTEDWEALAVELVVARYAAGVLAMVAGGAPPGIITLDISPPPPSAEDGTPPLRIGEWDTVQLTYTVRGDAEWRGAAAAVVPMYSAEAVKMELDPGTVPRGLAAGLAGSFKGGRRLVLVPAEAAAAGVTPPPGPGAPRAPLAPPPRFLLYDATVSRVKKAKKEYVEHMQAAAAAAEAVAAGAAAATAVAVAGAWTAGTAGATVAAAAVEAASSSVAYYPNGAVGVEAASEPPTHHPQPEDSEVVPLEEAATTLPPPPPPPAADSAESLGVGGERAAIAARMVGLDGYCSPCHPTRLEPSFLDVIAIL